MTGNTEYPHKLLPFSSRFVEIGGHRMHYLDEGSGPVVLLLHGNPTWCFFYRNVIKNLKDRFRLIAPDFIGCGLSDHPTDDHFRAAQRVEHMQEFIEKLGLEKFSLVVHDWGGSIGTALAARNKEKIEKIVYLNTTLTETEALPRIIKLAATPGIGKFLTKYTRRFLKFTTGVGLGVAKKLPKDIREAYHFPYRSSARRTAIWDFVDDIPFDTSHPSYATMLDLAEQIPSLQDIPVQIIWGLRDPCFHREMLSKVAAHFPDANILEIPDASHLVLEDSPELVVNTIRRFLVGEDMDVEGPDFDIGQTEKGQNVLYASLIEQAEKLAHRPAAIDPLFLPDSVKYGQLTFSEMLVRIRQYERGLVDLGMKSGDKVLMLVPAGADFLALSYAVMARGAIPIFIDPGIGRENLFRCIQDIDPDVMIGSPKAQLLRLKGKQLFPNLKFHVTSSSWFFPGGPTLSHLRRYSSKPLPQANVGKIAFVAFTSGATGLPKGVVFTNAMLREQLRIFRDVFHLEAGKRDLPLLPIFSLFNLASGICSIFPPIDSSKPLSLAPDRIVKIIHDLQIDYSFGSPTLWNKIAEYCVRSKSTLGPLQKILMAGAPVPPSVLSRVRDKLEHGEAFTPYGATEALPVTLVAGEEIGKLEPLQAVTGECGTFVGKAIPGVEVRVIEPVESPVLSIREVKELPVGEIGEVIVKGNNISPIYFRRPEATRHAKIPDETGFWHRMGDMGYLDQSGALYFCGRKAHRVVAPTRTYYSVPVENIFNQHARVKRTALISLGAGKLPGIAVELLPHYQTDAEHILNGIKEELLQIAAHNELTREIKDFFFHKSFPVDARHNAKIYRDQLSTWAQQQLQVKRAA